LRARRDLGDVGGDLRAHTVGDGARFHRPNARAGSIGVARFGSAVAVDSPVHVEGALSGGSPAYVGVAVSGERSALGGAAVGIALPAVSVDIGAVLGGSQAPGGRSCSVYRVPDRGRFG